MSIVVSTSDNQDVKQSIRHGPELIVWQNLEGSERTTDVPGVMFPLQLDFLDSND